MEYKKPTYEEYCNATKFAKFRYRFSIYIQLIAIILLILLCYYTIMNVEEMKTNPIKYAEEKMNVNCIPGIQLTKTFEQGEYGSNRNIRDS